MHPFDQRVKIIEFYWSVSYNVMSYLLPWALALNFLNFEVAITYLLWLNIFSYYHQRIRLNRMHNLFNNKDYEVVYESMLTIKHKLSVHTFLQYRWPLLSSIPQFRDSISWIINHNKCVYFLIQRAFAIPRIM